MHYYQFNIGDYAKSTKHLSPMEDLAYRRMLDLFYDSERPLPCEIAAIARLIVMREYQEEIRQVLIEFWIETNEGWINKRASKDMQYYIDKSEKAKASANARWAKQKESDDNAGDMRTHSECNANQNPITNNHKPIKEIVSKDTCQNSNEFLPAESQKIPYQEIVDLFGKYLSSLPQPKKLTEARRKAVKARHINDLKGKVQNWERYFKYISENCKWMASGEYNIDFDYLIKQSNFIQILEGAKNDRA